MQFQDDRGKVHVVRLSTPRWRATYSDVREAVLASRATAKLRGGVSRVRGKHRRKGTSAQKKESNGWDEGLDLARCELHVNRDASHPQTFERAHPLTNRVQDQDLTFCLVKPKHTLLAGVKSVATLPLKAARTLLCARTDVWLVAIGGLVAYMLHPWYLPLDAAVPAPSPVPGCWNLNLQF